MDKAALLAAYDEELRRKAPYFDDAVRLETDGPIVRLLGATADAGNNCVLFSALTESDAAATIDRQVSYFKGLGRGFEWKLHDHDAPANLRALLLERGFTAETDEVIMALGLAQNRIAGAAPAGYEVRPWSDDETLADLAEVQKAVWTDENLGWLVDSLARERASRPESIRFHGVWQGKQPVSVGWTRLHGRFASLFGGSTLKEHRGRGLYRALLASRLDEARRLGAEYALVDAGPMSRPILAKLGFSPLTGSTPFTRRFDPLK